MRLQSAFLMTFCEPITLIPALDSIEPLRCTSSAGLTRLPKCSPRWRASQAANIHFAPKHGCATGRFSSMTSSLLEGPAQDLATPRSFSGFRDFHTAKSIVVCGCGTSLASFSRPERFVTIGVNGVGRLFDPDYLVVVNPRNQFQTDRFSFVETSRAKAIFTHLELGISHSQVVRFQLGKRGGTDFSNRSTLHYTNNSPYVALCLAIHMGAKKIGLIGVDFTNDHFFAPTGRHRLAGQLPQIDREYKALYDACRHHGIQLYNLSASSRLTSLPRLSVEEFAGAPAETQKATLHLVSYATTPVAGVPAILARCISARTPHQCRAVWPTNAYSNGVAFQGDVEWQHSPDEAENLIESADLVIVHNGKVDPRHRSLLAIKPVITVAHNYMWNVDQQFVAQGMPGLVVGQYQATLPEFREWGIVPNPVPLWGAGLSA